MTESEIEIERIKIESDRLQFDKEKAEQDRRFWIKNFGTVITTTVSLAAVLVTAGQLWLTKISKDKEIAVTSAQKDKELALMQAQKDKELTLLVAQQDREWNLNAAKFVSENANVIFGKDKEQRERIAKVIIVTFPPNISDALFQKLDTTQDSAPGQTTWRTARENIIPKIQDPQPPVTNLNYGSLTGQYLDRDTNRPITGARITLNNLSVSSLNFQTVTDDSGNFRLDKIAAFPLGHYSISAVHPDYEMTRQFLSIQAGANTISLSSRAKKQTP